MAAPCSHHSLLDELAAGPAGLTRDQRLRLLTALEQLRGWLDGREAALLSTCERELDDVNSGAKGLVQLTQRAAGVGFGEAKRRVARSHWLPHLPRTARALEAGELGVEGADLMVALVERIDPGERATLAAAEHGLVEAIADLTPPQARRHLLAFEAGLRADDANTRFERHQRANRFSVTKNPDGTSRLSGQLDPLAAARLRTCIDHKVEALWRDQCRMNDDQAVPPPEVLANERLRARALLELVEGGHRADPQTSGKVQLMVHIDYRTLLAELDGIGLAELDDGTPVPPDQIRRVACEAGILPAVLGTESVPLDLGRSSRVASTAQRNALRLRYSTCAVRSCDTPFDHCDMHHIVPWQQGGRTDLDNLAPVCGKDHDLIHSHGWQLVFHTDGSAELRRSDEPRPDDPDPPG